MLNILIVDDSTIFRKILLELLQAKGHNVVGEACNGLEGVDMFEKLRPDVTFIDNTMPIMNGLQALKKIKEKAPDASIVMVSSTASQENMAEALINGAYDFLRKPIDQERLYEVLSDLEGQSINNT